MNKCKNCESNDDLLCLKYGIIISDENECVDNWSYWMESDYISKYQEKAARTINKELTPIGLKNHALHGMVGEIGEIHSIYQKSYQGHEIDEEHLKKEFGDLLWFISEYCTASEWNLGDIMEMNIKKLEERYPDGFDYDKSLNRKDGDI